MELRGLAPGTQGFRGFFLVPPRAYHIFPWTASLAEINGLGVFLMALPQ